MGMIILVRSISKEIDHVFDVSAFSINGYLTVWGQTKLNLDVTSDEAVMIGEVWSSLICCENNNVWHIQEEDYQALCCLV